jgi:hypothetical protein
MEIEFKIEELDKRIVTMGRLKSGCDCWNKGQFHA